MTASGVKKLHIGALTYGMDNALIIGVICAKKDIKIFPAKRGNELRGVWGFTLKDFDDSINVTFWGSADNAKKFNDTYKVGDVVEIRNPKITMKPQNNFEAINSPAVSSTFQLTLQENHSYLAVYSEPDSVKFRDLLRTPIKPAGVFLRLSDIFAYGTGMNGEFVNLLVAVRSIGAIRTVKSKMGASDLVVRDIVVMDQTHLEFYITLWQEDALNRPVDWLPRQTILFFADIRLSWNGFRQSVTGTVSPRTIITEDPKTPEAESLRKYASTVPIQSAAILDQASKVIDASQINVVMSTAQVMDKAYDGDQESKFTALLFVTVTQLDLDSVANQVIAYQCSGCNQILETPSCSNLECLVDSQLSVKPTFKLDVDLTDHRGTLRFCRLVSPSAENILKCSVEEFLKLSYEKKTQLKWQFLLMRCEVRILVLRPTAQRTRPLISILTCSPAKSDDVSARLPLY